MYKYILPLVFFFTGTAYAETGIVSGAIKHIRIHDGVAHTSSWTPPIFWFSLEGVASAGQCKKYNGSVLFVMDTDQAYSMIMAAFMAGKEVSLRYDEELVAASTYCKATYVTIGNPPPTY